VPSAELLIANKLGLHARASAKLPQVASGFQREWWLTRNGRRVYGKGATVTVDADGEDADAALSALRALVADRFGEEE